jgi:hypothetical protein
MRERKTRGDLLFFAISFALNGAVKVIRGLRHGLTDEERDAVADRAVLEMKKHGDPWRLNEDLPPLQTAAQPPHSQMQGVWCGKDRKDDE